MKLIAINGSPRKKGNTALLLEKALEGAASVGARTELVHLYDLDYKGCVSCFACKLKDGPGLGRCILNDGLRPLLDEIESADAIALGSPIYLGAVSGEMRSFLERLIFQYIEYSVPARSHCPRKINTAFIYTMNVDERGMDQAGYPAHLGAVEGMLAGALGSSESLYCCDTMQFDDYSKVVMERFDPEAKKRRREEIFPRDLEKAFALGVKLVS